MHESTVVGETGESEGKPAWLAVVSMSLGVFGLVGAEFLPASLLTPMAAELGVTEGMAGQAVTITAAVALVTSLCITTVVRSFDRRRVLLAFSFLLILSNLLVAAAPNLPLLLAGRILLGVALGGFWTLSAATMMRLVPERYVARALSIMFSGVSAATIFAAPSAAMSATLPAGVRSSSALPDWVCWRSSYSSPRCRRCRRAARPVSARCSRFCRGAGSGSPWRRS